MDFNRPNILASIGAPVIDFTESCGMLFLFTVEAFRRIFARHMIRRVAWQVYVIGAKSFWLILLIGLFTGMVLGLQGYYALVKFGADGFLGAAVALSLIRELGPVLTAMVSDDNADGTYTYQLNYVEAGSYKLALVCNASDDELTDTDDGNSGSFTPTIVEPVKEVQVQDPAVSGTTSITENF